MKSSIFTTLFLALAIAACGTKAPDNFVPDTEVSGFVCVGSSCVSAVVVVARDAEDESEVARSEPTDSSGAFSLSIPPTFTGELVLEASGAGATYVEPASGANATFGSQTRLRSPLFRYDEDQVNFEYYVDRASIWEGVIISPFSELATVYAEERQRAGIDPSFAVARDRSIRIFRDHVGYDYWSVKPVALTEGDVGTFGEAELAGAVGAGFSMLARRIAVASSLDPGTISSLSLLDALVADLKDAPVVLDGLPMGSSSPLTIGACPEGRQYCTISSLTLRADVGESIALFLSDDLNTSGLAYGVVEDFVEAFARRTGPLWLDAGAAPDRSPPTIAISNLQEGDFLTGEAVTFTVTITDAFALPEDGAANPITLERGSLSQIWTEGVDDAITVTRDESHKSQHQLDVELDSTSWTDGPLELHIVAHDATGNEATLVWMLHAENSEAGTVAGTFTLGGRVAGALMNINDCSGGSEGALLGSATTDATGYFVTEVAESPATTAICITGTKPVDGDASYVSMSSGATIQLGTDDEFEVIIEDWVDGQNRTAHVTPYTHMASAFARGLWATRYIDEYGPDADLFDESVADAYALLEEHFNDGNYVNLREVRPADMTEATEVTTLNPQVRYALSIAALAQLADAQAAESEASPASMNTITLTKRLAADLRDDTELAALSEPLWDGHNAMGPLMHGDVSLSSFSSRVDLAIAMVNFIELNPNDASEFIESDIMSLLDHISLDDNSRLYPEDEQPIAYDLIFPGPVIFTAPTPSDGVVMRGSIDLRATAEDNRKLISFVWDAPSGITGSNLDTSAGMTGPWVLVGQLSLEGFADGEVTLRAIATDEAMNATAVERTVVVDKTNPVVVIGAANDGSGILAPGAWTGSAELVSVTGTVSDANGATAQYRWPDDDAPWTPLPLSGGAWTLTNLPMGSTGVFSLEVRATDPAGNTGSTSASWNRDATAPSVGMGTPVAMIEPENDYTTSVSSTSVTYHTGSADPVAVQPPLNYSKYADRYSASGPNLPSWRFLVSDNHTAAGGVLAEYRVLRGATVLTNWAAFTTNSQTGYNRTVTISGGIHESIAHVDGTYSIEYRATDEFGNQSSVGSVSWTQTIINPVLYVADDVGTHFNNCDPSLARYYSMGNGPCASNNFADAMSNLPGPGLRVAAWRIWNPNSIAVRVRPSGMGLRAYKKRGHIYTQADAGTPVPSGWGEPNYCALGADGIRENGSCYTLPSPGDSEDYDIFSQAVMGYSVTAIGYFTPASPPVAVAPCVGCASDEREIPAGGSIVLAAYGSPLDFLDDYGDEFVNVPAMLDLQPVAGRIEALVMHCDSIGGGVCMDWTMRRSVRHLTRARVDFGADTDMQSRSSDAASWKAADGVGTVDQVAATEGINQAESGYSLF